MIKSYYKEENISKQVHIDQQLSTRYVYNDQPNPDNFVPGDDEDTYPQGLLIHAAKNHRNLENYSFRPNLDARRRDSTSSHWWVCTLTPSRNLAPFCVFEQIRGSLTVEAQLQREIFDAYPSWGGANDRQNKTLSFVAFLGRQQIVMQSGGTPKTFRLVSPSNPQDVYGRIHTQPGD